MLDRLSERVLDSQIQSQEKKIEEKKLDGDMLEVAKKYLSELKAEKARREGAKN